MKTGSFVDTILLHVCPAVAPRRGRVSAIFYACMELQTLILAILGYPRELIWLGLTGLMLCS